MPINEPTEEMASDGHGRRDQRQHGGDLDAAALPQQLARAAPADADARPGKDQPQDQRGDALQPLMAVGVLGVLLPLGEAHADPGDQRGEHIRERVYGVRDHRARFAQETGQELEYGKQHVAEYPDVGKAVHDLFFVHGDPSLYGPPSAAG